jgi:hypothetical protein
VGPTRPRPRLDASQLRLLQCFDSTIDFICPLEAANLSRIANTADILSLPPELQTEIVDYLTSKADLKSLCLTCKTLGAIATPLLYRNMVISTVDALRPDKGVVLNPENMKHVRRLELIQNWPSSWVIAPLSDLLQAIPSHQLEYFGYLIFVSTPNEMVDTNVHAVP